MFTTLGLYIVIVLLFVLFYLNYRKKIIILSTSKQLVQAEARYHAIFEQSPISLWEEDLSEVKKVVDALRSKGVKDIGIYFDNNPELLKKFAGKIRITDVNDCALKLYELQDKKQLSCIADILPQGSEWIIKEEIVSLLEKGRFDISVENRTLSGKKLNIELRAVVASGYEESWKKVYASVLDITEQTQLKVEKKEYEKQLHQSQKLEAIGSLAGGIAHDFNNILSPIIGRVELMALESKNDDKLQEHCQSVLDASKRARDLIKQILTFSRELDQEISPVSFAKIINEVVHLIPPTLPSTIELKVDIENDLPMIMADATQIHQVVMNLVTNGLHAMGNSNGTLSITLKELILDLTDCFEESLFPGRYLQLEVRDTGHGMDKATMEKVFDPYFTTKSRDKGTGLGLSVVHGILKGFGGAINVTSDVNVGSSFIVYLPVISLGEKHKPIRDVSGPLPRGNNEHVLLVDDEISVAEVTKNMLEKLGYKVTMRVSSMEALEAYRNLQEGIDLVMTDLTMPHLTGLQLFTRVRQINDTVPVIITTGFSEQMDRAKSKAIGVDAYLPKPVLMEELAFVIREVLDQ